MFKKIFVKKEGEAHSGMIDNICRYVLVIVGWEIGKWLFF